MNGEKIRITRSHCPTSNLCANVYEGVVDYAGVELRTSKEYNLTIAISNSSVCYLEYGVGWLQAVDGGHTQRPVHCIMGSCGRKSCSLSQELGWRHASR